VSLVGDVRPILENSTACTIVNANLSPSNRFSGWLGFLWIELNVSGHSFGQIELVRVGPIPGSSRTPDVSLASVGGVQTFTESLILAQDERWRRA
jgi:hypothetical protein